MTFDADPPTPVITTRGVAEPPPEWALWQRRLFDEMNAAAVAFVDRYTRSDGTLVWRREWPGMDGSDDAYESFYNFPLLYLLGGAEKVHELGRRQWDAITWQFTQYGQIHNEFDAYYDWMHHGESSLFLYFFGLADPTRLKDAQRAVRFAAMYTGEDPEAPNYDPVRKLIRSPINGSRGPRSHMTAEDWVTHRPVLANYPAPFDDIPGVKGPIADWNDDAVFAEILRLMNERMARGDVPLNLTATSLVANAFLYTGEPNYRSWVEEYVSAWRDRATENGGLLPDNVGPSGVIGECMGGKWWGGYYGYRWPHGIMNGIESSLIAGANAALLTSDLSWLELPRRQLAGILQLSRTEKGRWLIPYRHGDEGWRDYRPPDARWFVQLWFLSRAQEDRQWLERCLDEGAGARVASQRGKGDQSNAAAWYRFVTGRNVDYPNSILRANFAEMHRRLQLMAQDDDDVERWDVHHWQQTNPLVCEGLVQLTLGAPAPIYHGGLLHATVRYFDAERQRAGLPQDVAALVDSIDDASARLTLVNTSLRHARELIVQAGSFAEHRVETVCELDGEGAPLGDRTSVGGPRFRARLEPATTVRLDVQFARYVNQPTYGTPWTGKGAPCPPLLRGRRRDED